MGLLAVPSGLSSNELWDLHRQVCNHPSYGEEKQKQHRNKAPALKNLVAPSGHKNFISYYLFHFSLALFFPSCSSVCRLQGARLLKLFHAGQVTPPILKSMMSVTPLRAMNIAPSGGVSPDNFAEWLDAGAVIVGMGSNLAGSDINYDSGMVARGRRNRNWKQNYNKNNEKNG